MDQRYSNRRSRASPRAALCWCLGCLVVVTALMLGMIFIRPGASTSPVVDIFLKIQPRAHHGLKPLLPLLHALLQSLKMRAGVLGVCVLGPHRDRFLLESER